MMKTLIFIVVLSFSSVVQADALKSLELPLDGDRKVKGYDPFPVVQCPSVKSKYSELISKLSGIKDRLKKEACSEERQEVQSFEQLLGEDRKTFVDLVKKGTNEELSNEEIDRIKGYVDKVVRKTAKISGLLNNSACFDEDEVKQSVLGLLASTIDSTAGVLGHLAGKWGMKLKLGGKFVAGLLSSIDKVVRENRAYTFGNYNHGYFSGKYSTENYKKNMREGAKDRVLYVNSLCAYYQLKEELDEISDPGGAEELYHNFRKVVKAQLKRYEEECSDCAKIIQDYEKQKQGGLSFSLSSQPSRPVALKKMQWNQLEEYYSDLVNSANRSFSTPEGAKGPGHKTIRSLTTLVWTEMQLERIWKEQEDDSMDQARDAVPYLQQQIESFLVDQEGSRFIASRFKATTYLYNYLRHYITEKYRALDRLRDSVGVLRGSQDSNEQKIASKDPVIHMIHDIYADDIDFASILQHEGSENLRAFRRSVKKELRQSINNIYRAYSSGYKFCRFFQRGALGTDHDNNIGYECQLGMRKAAPLRKLITDLQETSMAAYNGRSLDQFNMEKEVVVFGKKAKLSYTANWVESLTEYIRWRVADPDMLTAAPPSVNNQLELDFQQN